MLSKRFSRLVKIFTGTNSGVGEELLQLEGRLERFAHFWTLAVRHFVRNRCLVRAEALAYTTLLALIPLLAVAVGITSAMLKSQGEDQIYHEIDGFVSTIMPPATIANTNHIANLDLHPGSASGLTPGNGLSGTNLILTNGSPGFMADTNQIAPATTTNFDEDTREVTAQKEAAKSIHDYIQNAQKGKYGLSGIGMILFVLIAMAMLRRVEETFNDIWGVTQGRKWWRQLSTHFTIITFGPVVLVAATIMANGHYLHATNYLVEKMPFFGRLILQTLPLIVLWFTFALFYLLAPNTQVKFSAAFIGGAVAGTLWHLNNIFAFLYVSRVITNSQIYGKLGLVPVLMLGLYFSWVIVLFGAQVAYAYQNRAVYLQDKIADNVNQRGREFVALRIMTLLGQRFQNGLSPAPVAEISAELGVPSRLTQRILRTLAAAHLVTEVAGDENAYIPARPLDTITAHHILLALRTGSGRELLVEDAHTLAGIYGDFARIEAAERAASEKISVLTLVQHLPAQFSLATPEKPKSIAPEKPGGVEDSQSVEKFGEPQKIEVPVPAVPTEKKLTTLENLESEIARMKPAEPPTASVVEIKMETVPEISLERQSARRETVQPGETEFPL
jgi:membrane protein